MDALQDKDIPTLRPGLEIERVRLSVEEAYLVSRADGRTSVEQLAQLCGWPIAETRPRVAMLIRAGVFVVDASAARPQRPPRADSKLGVGAAEGPDATADLPRREPSERSLRRSESSVFRERFGKAKEWYEQAVALRAKGDRVEALRLARLAAAYKPSAAYEALESELEAETLEHRLAPLLRRGAHFESLARWEEAITPLSEAVRIAPDHGPARLRLAHAMLLAGREPSTVLEHAARALKALPEEAEAHFVRGLCFERSGSRRAAIAAYDRAVELRPGYAAAQKRSKRLRWGF